MTVNYSTETECRVCRASSKLFFWDSRDFYKCPECLLIFSEDVPEKDVEESHYKQQWDTTDPGHWKNQADVLLQLISCYRTPKRILDFGSGSGELTKEFQVRGYDVTPLEPMIHGYLKDQNYPYKFDVVVAVEVIEHLPHLWEVLRELGEVMTPDGIAVFTTLLTNTFIEKSDARELFRDWWYKDDPTHVSFFCNRTLEKLADIGHYEIDVIGNNVLVLKRETP